MELSEYSRFVFALGAVIGLIWLLAHLAKRFKLDEKFRGVTGAQGRIQVRDVHYLDAKRRITIIRVDQKEYVLLLAPDHAELIDTREVTS